MSVTQSPNGSLVYTDEHPCVQVFIVSKTARQAFDQLSQTVKEYELKSFRFRVCTIYVDADSGDVMTELTMEPVPVWPTNDINIGGDINEKAQ